MDKWIEIDVSAVKHNLHQVQALLKEGTRLIAVVKANAYGHGAPETARTLCEQGVDFLAVSFLAEALQLRNSGISADILVFSPVITSREAKLAFEQRLTLTIASLADLDRLSQAGAGSGGEIKVHIKIDTGLGRFGLNEEEAIQVAKKLADLPYIYVEGIYTHIADPASPSYTSKQFRRFQQLVNGLEEEGVEIPIKHAANSAIFLKHAEMHLDAVRIGTLLSGQHPVGHFPERLQLRDPYKYKTRIISVKTLPSGSYLGYARTFRLSRTAQIAVIPVGFNDGLGVEVGNPPAGVIDLSKKLAKVVLNYLQWQQFNGQVKIKGREYPIRGKVFMQMALIEVPTGIQLEVGDEIEVPIRKTLASACVPRIYI